MMRVNQTKAQRKASRRDVSKNLLGIFSYFRIYTKLHLAFALFSLCLSIILLFIGTCAYYEAAILRPQSTTTPSTIDSDSNNANTIIDYENNSYIPFYISVMRLYGINETDFQMLIGDGSSSSLMLLDDGQPYDENYTKLHKYQISMVFVAVVSILIEVGLICSIILEHFKLSLLYNLIMAAGLIYHLINRQKVLQQQQSDQHQEIKDGNFDGQEMSLIYQSIYLALCCFYSLGIKAKNKATDRILMKNDFELRSDERFIQKA